MIHYSFTPEKRSKNKRIGLVSQLLETPDAIYKEVLYSITKGDNKNIPNKTLSRFVGELAQSLNK